MQQDLIANQTVTCTVKFSDGQEVSATVWEANPGQLSPISYEGAIERLHLKPKTATPDELAFLFRRIAAMATGSFMVSRGSAAPV